MLKIQENRANAILQCFRVECNNGNKTFADEDRAMAYFDYMSALGFSVEMWIVVLHYDEHGALSKGEQRLLAVETPDGFIGLFK